MQSLEIEVGKQEPRGPRLSALCRRLSQASSMRTSLGNSNSDSGGTFGKRASLLGHSRIGKEGKKKSEGSQVMSWSIWPMAELVVLVTCVLPPVVIVFNRLSGSDFFVVSERLSRLEEWILKISVWVHAGYLVLRMAMRDYVRLNGALVLVLLAQRGVLEALIRASQEPPQYFLEVRVEGWNRIFALGYGVVLMLIGLRFYFTLSAFRSLSRRLVSQKKRRFVDTKIGVDLDLTYITNNIIAMGWPTETFLEQQFRNPMDQVQLFLNTRHSHHYKVYNLCAERVYQQKCFEREYHNIRFPDHNPCPLAQIGTVCKDMEDFIRQSHSRNVVAVHCKAGKGRTGLVIAAFLLHTRKCIRAADALAMFGKRRTYNGKGVTIPSQIRYVHHYEAVVREGGLRPKRWLRLVRVEVAPEVEYPWRLHVVTPEDGVVFDTAVEGRPPVLEGDLKLVAFVGMEKIFQVWLHTAYDPQRLMGSHVHQQTRHVDHLCPAEHTTQHIKAYVGGTCDKCNDVVQKNDHIYECRICDPIMWHCERCVRGAGRSPLVPAVAAIRMLQRAKHHPIPEEEEHESADEEVVTVDADAEAAEGAVSSTSTTSAAPAGAVSSSASAGPTGTMPRAAGDGMGKASSVASREVTCPRGHVLSSSSYDKPWECYACSKRSWEKKRIGMERMRCEKCNFDICRSCYTNPSCWRCRPNGPTSVVWAADTRFQPAPHQEAWAAVFKKKELDGPHKDDMEACPAKALTYSRSLTVGLQEVRFIFVEATREEIRERQLEEARSRVHREKEKRSLLKVAVAQGVGGSGLVAGSATLGGGAVVNPAGDLGLCNDYDDLENDTDNEENLTILCRGYLLRRVMRCSKSKRRLCELHTSGRLHIAGSSFFNTLVVNMTEGAGTGSGAVFHQETRSGQQNLRARTNDSEVGGKHYPRVWWVRNPRTQGWERLEAETPDAEERWDEAFTDALRFSSAGVEPGTVFRGFFWLLVGDVDPERLAAILADQWRARLFVLQDDGRMMAYSHADQQDAAFCDLQAGNFTIRQLQTRLRGLQNMVVFQLPDSDCFGLEHMRYHTLAASPEDFAVFEAKANGLLQTFD